MGLHNGLGDGLGPPARWGPGGRVPAPRRSLRPHPRRKPPGARELAHHLRDRVRQPDPARRGAKPNELVGFAHAALAPPRGTAPPTTVPNRTN